MKGLVCILLVFAVLVLAVCIVPPLYNDHVASQTAKQISEIELPEKTECMESVSKAGKLAGNGNGMQYFGAILIRSALSLEELQKHYDPDGQSRVIVKPQSGSKITQVEHAKLSFSSSLEEAEGMQYYIVYTWGSSQSFWSNLDLRGH